LLLVLLVLVLVLVLLLELLLVMLRLIQLLIRLLLEQPLMIRPLELDNRRREVLRADPIRGIDQQLLACCA
jgi:hypothetical protein